MKKLTSVIVVAAILCFWGFSPAVAGELGFYREGGVSKLAGPDYKWWYGCTATSAGMMMGYYDRQGYDGRLYNNLVPGGKAEASTFPIPNSWSYLANNAIASWGHVTDFYRFAGGTPDYTNGGNNPGSYLNSGDDQASTHSFNCLADFMGTSQDSVGNVNGSTTLYSFTNGARFYARDAFNYGVYNSDGMYGMAEYLRYAGYGGDPQTDTNFFTQLIRTGNMTQGFTFSQYKAEINAGRVVMIHVEGHSMFGYGYNDAGQLVYLHDTWGAGEDVMTWGGSYSGLAEWGVTCFTPTGGSPVPLPSTLLLFGSGLAGFVGFRFRLKK